MTKSRSKGLAALRASRPANKIIEGMENAAQFAAGDMTKGRIVYPSIVFDQEADGRHIAEVTTPPGAIAYGVTQAEAVANVLAIWREAKAVNHD